MAARKRLPTGLFYHPRSKFIYFKIKKWDEKQNKFVWSSPKSSGTEDIAVALKTREEAQALSDKIREVKSDTRMSHEAALKMVNSILRWHNVPEVEGATVPTWMEVRDKWLATQKTLCNARADGRPGVDPLVTYKNYKSRLAFFDRWLDGKDFVVSRFSREDGQQFCDDKTEEGYQPKYIHMAKSTLSSIFEQLRDDGHIKKNPWKRVKITSATGRRRDPFTFADIQSIWKGVEGLEHSDEWKTVVLFGLVLGCRIKDCTIRQWSEISLNDPAHIIYSPGKTISRNNPKKHDVRAPLVDPLYSHLLSIAGDSTGYLTPNLAKQKNGLLTKAFSGLLADLDIPMRTEKGVKTWHSKSFHSWRDTLPSLMAAQDVPPEIRMAVVGHTDESIHLNYTHHEDQNLRKHMERTMSVISL